MREISGKCCPDRCPDATSLMGNAQTDAEKRKKVYSTRLKAVTTYVRFNRIPLWVSVPWRDHGGSGG